MLAEAYLGDEIFDVDSRITQLFVPGRGIEPNSAEYPGLVLHDSPDSWGTWERSVMAGQVAKRNKQIGTVVFSGDMTFLMTQDERPNTTEAEAGELVAKAIYKGIPSQTETESRTSFRNIINCFRVREDGTSLLDPNQVTGVVIHDDHAEHFLKAAKLVLPFTEFVIISANRPDSDKMRVPNRNDRIADALFSVAMLGVRPGDIDKIAKRDELVVRNVSRVVNGFRKLLGKHKLLSTIYCNLSSFGTTSPFSASS